MDDIKRGREVDAAVGGKRFRRWIDEANIFQVGFPEVGVRAV